MNGLTLTHDEIVGQLEIASEKTQNIFDFLLLKLQDDEAVEKFEELHRSYKKSGLNETLEVYNHIIARYERMFPEQNFSFCCL